MSHNFLSGSLTVLGVLKDCKAWTFQATNWLGTYLQALPTYKLFSCWTSLWMTWMGWFQALNLCEPLCCSPWWKPKAVLLKLGLLLPPSKVACNDCGCCSISCCHIHPHIDISEATA
jgi:hypothetical protein